MGSVGVTFTRATPALHPAAAGRGVAVACPCGVAGDEPAPPVAVSNTTPHTVIARFITLGIHQPLSGADDQSALVRPFDFRLFRNVGRPEAPTGQS
jgi:hypothetical protein